MDSAGCTAVHHDKRASAVKELGQRQGCMLYVSCDHTRAHTSTSSRTEPGNTHRVLEQITRKQITENHCKRRKSGRLQVVPEC